MPAASPESGRHLRLRGKVGGRDRTFPLRSGLNVIGRDESCDVLLPSRGVSLRHARLTVGPTSPVLEDLESKNGCFVNGSRVRSVQLAAGDELWLGSVELVLEEVDPGEDRLAVDLAPRLESESVEVVGEATPTLRQWFDVRLVEDWLGAIDTVVDCLEEAEGLQAALAAASARLGVRAAAILELSAGGGVVLAACGELDESLGPRLRSWVETLGTERAGAHFDTVAGIGGEPLTAAALTGGPGPPLALALSGEFRGRSQSEALLTTVLRLARRRLARQPARPRPTPARGGPTLAFPPGYVPGVSPAIRRLHGEMEPLAQSNLPVLIRGETGVGKEWIARILHHSSSRRRGPFVPLNCAAVPAELLEPELFGIGKGVATGVDARRGRFLEAQGGTLFLDEVADLPLRLQPKLLRALESGEIHPVGRRPVAIDVRIIAATNTDLTQHLDERFRADLYYRLAGADLLVPPLRERREDLPMLVEHYLRQISREARKPIRGMTVAALSRLVEHPWPGNVRELVHEVRRVVYVCPAGEAVETAHLVEHLRRPLPVDGGPDRPTEELAAPAEPSPAADLEAWFRNAADLRLDEIECAALAEALRRTDGNQVQAGRLLGISRMAVRRRLDRCRERGLGSGRR